MINDLRDYVFENKTESRCLLPVLHCPAVLRSCSHAVKTAELRTAEPHNCTTAEQPFCRYALMPSGLHAVTP